MLCYDISKQENPLLPLASNQMDSYYDYNECREEWLFEMQEDAMNTFDEEEEDPSLTARERNPSLT